MPSREFRIGGFQPYVPEPETKPAPGFGEILEAGFGLENDVLAAYELLTAPKFKIDNSFNLKQKLQETELWDEYRDNFIGVGSLDHFNFVASQIDRDERRRDVLLRAGGAGTAAAIGAGVLSPTMFIPIFTGGRGLAAVARGAAYGAAASGLQEIPLQMNQPTRTLGESAFAIGAGTVLGGILGGSVAALRKGEAAQLEADMYTGLKPPAISSVGAASADLADPGGLAPGAGYLIKALDSNPVSRSPTTYVLSQGDYSDMRVMMAQLDDAGMATKGNALGIPTAEGGTVANNVTVWEGNYADFATTLDDAFRNYVFDGTPPKFAPNVRAKIRAYWSSQKMSRDEFKEEVFRAAYSGRTHENKFVEEVAQKLGKLEDDLLEAAQATPLREWLGDIKDNSSFIHWLFDTDKIRHGANQVMFVDFLAERYNKRLQEQFVKMYEKHQLRAARNEELIEDLQRGPEEIEALRDQLGAQLKGVEERMEQQQFTALEDTIASLRARARELTEVRDEPVRRQMLADAKDMEKAAGEQYAGARLERREIKRRLSNLNKATVVLEERLANKLGKIERAEELSENALMRVARKGQKILNEIEEWSDEKLDAELSELKTEFERVARIYDKGEERISKLVSEDTGTDADILGAAATQEQRADKLTSLTERIADAEDLGRPALRELLQNMLDETITRVRKINDRRAVRTARLRTAAADLAPEKVAAKLEGIRARTPEDLKRINERVTKMGGEFDDIKGAADFTGYAREAAELTKDKILGTMVRLPVVDMLQEERGAVLPRLLGFIPTEDMAPWLDKDVERIMMAHVRTMAPDIEIAKRLGSVDAEEWIGKNGRIVKQYNDKIRSIKEKGVPKKKGDEIVFDTDPAAIDKEINRLNEVFNTSKNMLEVQMRRLRNQEGLPKDPNGIGYRFFKIAQDLNVLRFMGGVALASVPDVSRPVMRNGLTRVFRDGYAPFVTNLKEMKLLRKELRQMGVAVDTVTSSRSYAMMDIMADLNRHSKFERGIHYATQRMGIVALFNYWTDGMKLISGATANARMLDSIAEVMNVKTKTISEVDAATGKTITRVIDVEKKVDPKTIDYLAQNGLSPQLIQRIWKEVEKGGGGKVNGVWLPNTADWTDKEAKRAFQAAVAREVNNNIVTPGLERPAWATSSPFFRALAQFKSFGMTSTYKTLAAGLQQKDAAFILGVMMSLALGSMSYYIYAKLRGGETEKEMMNAGLDKWADEALQRSGLLGALGFVQDIASRIPATAPFASFSGGRSTRRGGDDLLDALGGPTLDLVEKAAMIVTGLHDPTIATVHAARQLLPYQNVTLVSRIFDAIERASNEAFDIPERRR